MAASKLASMVTFGQWHRNGRSAVFRVIPRVIVRSNSTLEEGSEGTASKTPARSFESGRARKKEGNMKGLKTFLLGAAFSIFAASSLAASSLEGKSAPDFVLKSSAGENLRLSEYRGDVVMINFWATWCGPCRQEMPLLDDLYNRYQRVGFSLLGVNIDDDSRRAMQMIEELGVNFPVLFDERKEVSQLYEVEAMPVTVLVDREGTVRHVHHGFKPGYEEKYLTEIRSLLRE
jgi:peroxiredoxin